MLLLKLNEFDVPSATSHLEPVASHGKTDATDFIIEFQLFIGFILAAIGRLGPYIQNPQNGSL